MKRVILAAVALLAAVCRAAFLIAPGVSSKVAGFLIHSNWDEMTVAPSLTSFVGGVVVWALVAGLSAALAATLYNRLADRPVHA